MLWVDHSPSSPYRDNIYALWWNSGPTYVARRAGTAGTWQAYVQVSQGETPGGSDGGDIKTNTFGDVFTFWPSESNQQLFVAKSTDGGGSFGTPVKIANTFSSFLYHVPSDEPSRGTLLYITAAAYRTAAIDNVYAIWMDLAGGSSCNSTADMPGTNVNSACKTRIWYSRSQDGGATWSSPVKINDQSSLNDQFFPRLALDETSGDMMVVYYDTINDPGRLNTDIWMQTSTDDGTSWSAATVITTAETNETASGYNTYQYGDYIGLSGYAGQFFACWTDRRSGSFEEIWGAPIALVQRAVTLVAERDHYGQDEIDAARIQPGGPVVKTGLRLQVDGYTARELNITGPSSIGVAPLLVFSPSTGVSASCSSIQSTNSAFPPDELQRFYYNYNVNFGPTDIAFTSFSGLTEPVTVSTTYLGFSPTALVTFMKQPDPNILQGAQDWWLSSDVRLIQAAETDTVFGQTLAVGDNPYTFLEKVTAALEGGASGFDQSTTEANEVVTVAPNAIRGGQMVNVYNFAIARVHYQAKMTPANNVRVFFRLFAANSTATNFEPTTSFTRDPAAYPVPLAQYGEQCIPTDGVVAGEYVTIPCFAQSRASATQSGAANSLPSLQLDTNNNRNLPATGGPIKDFFYGCLLDINQSAFVLPTTPPPGNENGPWPSQPASNPMLTLQQAFVRNEHTCIVAEIAFDPDPITSGTPPYNSDKMAQRNISWSWVANPGESGSRLALETFEVRPTPSALPSTAAPDELLIDWTNVPAGQLAEIYLPAVNADAVLRKASHLYPSNNLSRIDAHTIGCTTGGITLIPLPAGSGNGANFAGLMSIQLPYGIKKGQSYTVVVRQLTNALGSAPPPPPPPPQIQTAARSAATAAVYRWRKVLGIFQITIPVSTKELLLENEEIRLSIFRWIGESIPASSRWYPVFKRYLVLLGQKVHALGGDPDQIQPSQNGYDGLPGRGPIIKPRPPHEHEEKEFTGKIDAITYDHFGDFEGFVLELFTGEHRRFESREGPIQSLVVRAWQDRILTSIIVDKDRPHIPIRVLLRRRTGL